MTLAYDKDMNQTILANLHDGLYFVDLNRTITFWNRAAEQMSGFRSDEVVGKSCAHNILTHVDSAGNNLCTGVCPLAATMADGTPREAEVYMHHKDGHRVPVSVRVSALTDSQGKIIGGVELFTDISSFAANALRMKDLEKLTLLDSLTRLANRTYIEREIQSRLEEYKRFNVPFGILLMDVDHFQKVNASYGHGIGDIVLKYIATTFLNASRPFDLYGRWGGEEFIGIIRNVKSEELEPLGKCLLSLIENSYIMDGGEKINITMSMGAAIVNAEDTVDSLLQRADRLLYKSKESGRNRLTLDG